MDFNNNLTNASNYKSSNFESPTSKNSTNSDSNSSLINSDGSTRQFIIKSSKTLNSKFHHIKDLDTFFKSIYDFHQGHGLVCILLKTVLSLFQYLFTMIFLSLLVNCIDYEAIFDNNENGHRKWSIIWKKEPTCIDSIIFKSSPTFKIFLIAASTCFSVNLYRSIKQLVQFIEIKQFYENSLKISSSKISDYTWYEVQEKLLKAQTEIQMCIHKKTLTELDIYNRILRFKNYMVAMANKEILPSVYIPGIGSTNFLSHNLKWNYKILFFDSWFSIFENSYNLHGRYKRVKDRKLLATQLSQTITILSIVNLILAPFILVWQIIYSFFTYVEMAKTDPKIFSKRRYTEYACLRLRHFNELDHEFNSRILRSHKPANRYLNSFKNQTLIILAEHLSYILGSILAVLIALTVYDEDVLKIEHALTAIGILTAIVTATRGLIPDEDEVNNPEQLLQCILLNVHYLPKEWRGHAHTEKVRSNFDKMFQLRVLFIIEELLSPIMIPYILFFRLRNKSLQIVDFFRNFTTSIDGVGDTCSLAMMDLLKHHDSLWSNSKKLEESIIDLKKSTNLQTDGYPSTIDIHNFGKKDQGKAEMSLIHFKSVNPQWKAPNQQTTEWLKENMITEEDERMSLDSMINFRVDDKMINSSYEDFPGRGALKNSNLINLNSSIIRLYENYGKGDYNKDVGNKNATFSVGSNTSAKRSKNNLELDDYKNSNLTLDSNQVSKFEYQEPSEDGFPNNYNYENIGNIF